MTPREGVQWGRDAAGRLVGLSKVDTWTKQRAARSGARTSPWRRGITKRAIALNEAWAQADAAAKATP